MFPRVTHPCATKSEDFVRLACVRPAASVRSEPGSNSQVDFLNQIQERSSSKAKLHACLQDALSASNSIRFPDRRRLRIPSLRLHIVKEPVDPSTFAPPSLSLQRRPHRSGEAGFYSHAGPASTPFFFNPETVASPLPPPPQSTAPSRREAGFYSSGRRAATPFFAFSHFFSNRARNRVFG
jgi:hypothetical protein